MLLETPGRWPGGAVPAGGCWAQETTCSHTQAPSHMYSHVHTHPHVHTHSLTRVQTYAHVHTQAGLCARLRGTLAERAGSPVLPLLCPFPRAGLHLAWGWPERGGEGARCCRQHRLRLAQGSIRRPPPDPRLTRPQARSQMRWMPAGAHLASSPRRLLSACHRNESVPHSEGRARLVPQTQGC